MFFSNNFWISTYWSLVDIASFNFLTILNLQSFQHQHFWNPYQNENASHRYTYKIGTQNFLLLLCLFLIPFTKNCPFPMFYFNPFGFSKALNMYKSRINHWTCHKYQKVNTDHEFNFFFMRRILMANKKLSTHICITFIVISFKYVFMIFYIAHMCKISIVPFILFL